MDALNGKRLVILGMARQGTALARFVVEAGALVTLSDLRPADKLGEAMASLADLPGDRLRLVLGEHPMTLLDNCDLLALSGGVATDAPLVIEARRRGIPLTNDSLEFMRRAPAPVVGITGSAGKTTTTALVGQMGQKSGRRTWVGGNIGRFLNHACKPNCYTEIVGKTIWIRAARNIKKGEELVYDYHTDGEQVIKCHCRPNCKRWL